MGHEYLPRGTIGQEDLHGGLGRLTWWCRCSRWFTWWVRKTYLVVCIRKTYLVVCNRKTSLSIRKTYRVECIRKTYLTLLWIWKTYPVEL